LETSVLFYFHNFIAQLRSAPRRKKIAIEIPTFTVLSFGLHDIDNDDDDDLVLPKLDASVWLAYTQSV
jgi:hypothetical protein